MSFLANITNYSGFAFGFASNGNEQMFSANEFILKPVGFAVSVFQESGNE